MKFSRRSLTLPVSTCLLLLPVVLGAGACGTEAPLPINAGGQSTGGTGVIPTGGTGMTPTGGTGMTPTGGTGMTPQGGNTTSGGAAAGTTSGGATTGGSGGTTSAGTTSGGSGGSGGSVAVDLKETVGGPLNGAMLLGPCLRDTATSVCATNPQGTGCPAKNPADPATGGQLTTDKTITLGGDPAKVYTLTLHVQGEVEAKGYTNGMDQNAQAANPKMDGLYVGGAPESGNDYNVYMARVSSPKQDYFLNSIKPPGVTNHTTYGMDYTGKIKANGGATIRLTAADTNCSMIKNCGPMENGGNQCTAPIVLQGMDPVAVSKNPTFDFTKAYNGQWIVLVVTDVTEG